MENNRTSIPVSGFILVYTLIWLWISGIFGLIAVFGFTKVAHQLLASGETDVKDIAIRSFLGSKGYWITALVIPFVIGLLAAL